MRTIARTPILLALGLVELVRRVPGASLVSAAIPLLAGLMLLGAGLLTTGYMLEHSPERVSLADLRAHNISSTQEWFIVTGDVVEEQALPGSYRYTLTDPGAPNAYLIVQSEHPWPVGHTTVSGRISGYVPFLPPDEPWYTSMHADDQLAIERPPPYGAMLLALGGIVLLAARRSTYPMFVGTPLDRSARANGTIPVMVHPDAERPALEVGKGSLDLGETAGINPTLRTDDGRAVPVRVHSRLTSVRVGELQTVTSREPVLRLLSASGDLYVGFRTRAERDAVAATLLYGM